MRFAKYFDKDLYSKWHRLWDGIAMADVDSVEICRNKGCWKPLAIIEHLYDTGSDKKKYTNIVEQIGKGLNIPVYLVYYKEVDPHTLSFRVAQKYPISAPLKAMSEQEWVGTSFHLQAEHQKVCKFKK